MDHDDRDELLEQVARRFQEGTCRRASFDALQVAFQPAVVGFFRRRGCGGEDARDLTQETFMRLWRELDRFRWKCRLTSWIFVLARATWIAWLRRKGAGKRRAEEVPVEDAAGEPALARSPDQQRRVEREDEGLRVRAALEALPTQERRCAQMFYLQERSVAEIALVLQVAEVTVRSHLFHARAKLRVTLAPDDGEAVTERVSPT